MFQSIENVAIIMDGNGRWAQSRFRPRIWGHVRGANSVSNIVEFASNSNLKSLTLYAFSVENWSRSKEEISFLFKLLDKFLVKERQKIINNNIIFNIIGEYDFLDVKTLQKINELKLETKKNTGLKLNFAFGYGSRPEILNACNCFIKNNPGKEIGELDFEKNLYDSSVPNIDLLIRTGGEKRLSNFLLWQLAYAELYFSDTYWPDFKVKEFSDILNYVSKRDRRFGGEVSSTSLKIQSIHANQQKEVFYNNGFQH